MIQSKGTSQGAFFDTEDMKPLVNNEAFGKALDFLKEIDQIRPAGRDQPRRRRHAQPVHLRPLRAVLDWGDIGTLAIDPATSKVIDKVGAVIMPGSKEVLNRDTGKLVACTADTCPYADRRRQPRPVRGFRRLVRRHQRRGRPKVKDAAYAFFSYMTSPRSRMST